MIYIVYVGMLLMMLWLDCRKEQKLQAFRLGAVVHLTGIEPARLLTMDPKSIVSTNSTTDAYCYDIILNCGHVVN